MNNRDAEKVIDSLSKKPFICSENYIKTDNDYVIVKKEYFEKISGVSGAKEWRK